MVVTDELHAGSPCGVYRGSPQTVVFGPGCTDQVDECLDHLGIERPMIVCGRSVADSVVLQRVVRALRGRRVTVFDGCRAHAPRSTVREGMRMLRSTGADGMVSVGGGSAVDTMRGIAMLRSADCDFDELPSPDPGCAKPMPLVAFSTTLSQAEFSYVVGITDDEGPGTKTLWFDRSLMPDLVVLDSQLTLCTPERLWLSTGVKALDTAVDLYFEYLDPQPFWEGMLLNAAAELVALLTQCRSEPASVDVRQRLQMTAWMATFPRFHLPTDRTRRRASRWFGAIARHQLGGKYQLPHGELAGVILPVALRIHAAESGQREEQLAAALGTTRDRLPDAIRTFVGGLGLPTALAAAGTSDEDRDLLVEAMLEEEVAYGFRPTDLESRRAELAATLRLVFDAGATSAGEAMGTAEAISAAEAMGAAPAEYPPSDRPPLR